MLSFRYRVIIALFAAPLVCALLYWIDSDPSYPNYWDTVREFTVISLILFPVMLGITWFFRRTGKS
jgi:hypothetical protein